MHQSQTTLIGVVGKERGVGDCTPAPYPPQKKKNTNESRAINAVYVKALR